MIQQKRHQFTKTDSILLLLVTLLLSNCTLTSPAAQIPPSTPITTLPSATIPRLTASPTATRPAPTATPLLLITPVATLPSSATPQPTPSPTAVRPSPTATLLRPTATSLPAPSPTAATPETLLKPENLSIGDPYTPELGNQGYEVEHYTLQLTLDPAVQVLEGLTTLEIRSTQPDLRQLSLDFVGFTVSEVLVEETPATFFRQADKLIINLPQAMAQAAPFGVAIAYSGQPPQEPSAYVPFAPHLGLHYLLNNSLFVVAEPDGARNWFPANDHPRDKATFRFELLVPAGLTGVANGLLVDVERDLTLPDGSPGDLYIWEVNDPMATYLATVAVAEYERVESVSPQGVLLRHYVFPEQRAAFETAVAPVGEMLDWLGERFGPYPFEAFGYVTTAQEGFTLETQTMVILSTGMMRENVIIHEMVHMWFGDWVSPASWGDIWRNEGFATYLSDMWETRDNPAALEERIAGYRQSLADNPSPYPLNQPPPEALFGRDSYLKGAVVAHALRQEIGDDAFFEGLRTYFERYGGGTASHAEFQAVLEEAAGVSLDEFFATWLK